MKLILDDLITMDLEKIECHSYSNDTIVLDCYSNNIDNDYRDIMKSKFDNIICGNDTYKNMYFYSYGVRHGETSIFKFTNNYNRINNLSVEDIYKIHDNLYELSNMLKNKQIPDTNNEFLQKLTIKTVDSIEVNRYGGYTMLSKDWIDDFAKWIGDRKVLEIGAGVGALSYELQTRNIDIIPIDDRSWDRFNWKESEDKFEWIDITKEDFFENYSTYADRDIFILSYPVQGEYSYEVLNTIRSLNTESLIVFIGPFRNDYVTDKFIESASVVSDSEFEKISKKYKYWTGHVYMQSNLLLLK